MIFESKVVNCFCLLLVMCVLTACNVTKFVPQGEYLLNDVKVEVEDTKDIPSSELIKYVQQKQNTEILGFWKLQLGIYNTASLDTTKWTSKNARKIGEPPVIFSSDMADASCAQLTKAMNNMGYFQATVDTLMHQKDQKINLTYLIQANQPYYIRTYSVDVEHDELRQIAQSQRQTLVHDGMQFDANALNEERLRVARAMRARGYFYFDQELIQFQADSNKRQSQIDVKMKLHDYVQELEDKDRIFRKYNIARVYFHIDYDPQHAPDNETIHQSSKEGYVFTWSGSKLLRDEIAHFRNHLEEQLQARKDQAAEEAAAKQDFADAVEVMEETERLKQEEANRERQRRREEREQKRYEEYLAAQQAIREEEERQERLRQEQEAEEARIRAEEHARDMAAVAVYVQALEAFRVTVDERLKMRAEEAERQRKEREAREEERRRRKASRQSPTN